MTTKRFALARVLSAAASLATLAGVAHAQPRYDFVLVDSFNANPLAGEAYLSDINDRGRACGQATVDNVIGYPGFVWDPTTGKARVAVASPKGVNNAGLVVGIGSVSSVDTGQSYSPPNLPGTYYSPSFGGVNDAGVAVGTISGCSCSDSGGVTYKPYVWDAVNGARTVSVPNARGLSRVNNAGVAIGWINGWTLNDAFFIDLESGAYTMLGDVFPSGFGSGPTRAFDINDSGAIVGTRYGTAPGSMYGYVYSPGAGLQILPFPGAGYQQFVRPNGINNAGTIVGDISTVQASQRAFVYSAADGIHDLNDASLVAGIPAGYRLYTAQKVNNLGWIVGYGHTAAGKVTGYVLKQRAGSCPADFDGNGFVNGDDFDGFVLEFYWGTSLADFDRNSFVNGDDFDGFVLAFEVGC